MKRFPIPAAVAVVAAFAGTAHATQVMHQPVNGIYVAAGSSDGATGTSLSVFRNVANGPVRSNHRNYRLSTH